MERACFTIQPKGTIDIGKTPLENQCLNINMRNHRGRLALHVAAEFASSKLVEYLLENGSRASAIDLRGCTALHRAADDKLDTLLKQGASLDARDENSRTTLHYMCRRSDDFALQAVLNLISRGDCLSLKDHIGSYPWI